MNQLIIREDKLIYNAREIKFNELLNERFYKHSDSKAHLYINETYIVNEAFLKWVQPAKAFEYFLKNNQIEYIEIEKKDATLFPIFMDVAKKCHIKTNKYSLLFRTKNIIRGHFTIILTFFYLLWKMLSIPYSNKSQTKNKKISVIRTSAAKEKMKFLKDVDINIESLKLEPSIYNKFSKEERVVWVCKAWRKAYSELAKYKLEIKKNVGQNSSNDSFLYYSKRIVHTIVYENLLEKYFSMNEGKIFYTGNNLDRFALIEEVKTKKYNIETVCIPHGLEFGFKLPKVFTGDVFYTTSEFAAHHLNNLYESKKFVFDKDIANQMFTVPLKEQKESKEIVFFTESREIEINQKILDELLPLLENENLKLNLKLHPKDKKSNYIKYENRVSFLESFNDSIAYNICFARKSTIILEAVYNHSNAAAILTSPKDKAIFNSFPSLQDSKLEVFYNTTELFRWIKNSLK